MTAHRHRRSGGGAVRPLHLDRLPNSRGSEAEAKYAQSYDALVLGNAGSLAAVDALVDDVMAAELSASEHRRLTNMAAAVDFVQRNLAALNLASQAQLAHPPEVSRRADDRTKGTAMHTKWARYSTSR